MITFAELKAHLEKSGRIKLLPQILRELKLRAAREQALAPRRESARENPSLIAGTRTFENGILTDHTAKRALIELYQNITA